MYHMHACGYLLPEVYQKHAHIMLRATFLYFNETSEKPGEKQRIILSE